MKNAFFKKKIICYVYIHGVEWIIICLVMILVVIENRQRDSVSYVIDHYLVF